MSSYRSLDMSISSPLFSVIVPTYNRSNLLSKAIDSVLGQKYQDWELLIIDDGSNDGTSSVVGAYRDRRIRYFHQAHQERSTARNRGIREALGKYICFLDDDDYYLENHLSTFFDWLVQHSYPDRILRTGFYKEEGSKMTATAQYHPRRDLNPVRFAAFNFCSVCTLCIPRECLLHDIFPPAFRHWQDTHLILRLLAKFPFTQLPAYTYAYVMHPAMGSRALYHHADALERIESNVQAILDLFEKNASLLSPFLPAYTQDYLVCQKYLGHANGALQYHKPKLAIQLLRASFSWRVLPHFFLSYGKFLLKLPFSVFQDRR